MNRRNGRLIASVRQMTVGMVICASLALAMVPAVGDASQDDGSSYTDPGFGWSISWDPELWMLAGSTATAVNEDGVAGSEAVITGIDQMALGAVFVGSQTVFGGDTAACLEDIKTETLLTSGISDGGDADLDLPQAPDDAEQALSFATIGGGGTELEGVVYVECRPLVEDEALLSIRWIYPDRDAYQDALPDFEELIAAIDLDGGEAAGDATGDEDGGSAEATADQDEPDTYTDPTYGWSITWDPAVWEGQEPEVIVGEDEEEGNLIDLYGAELSLGGVTIASLPSPTFAGDLTACVNAIRPLTLDELEGDGGYVENLREPDLALPEAPSDAVGKLFEWDAGLDESQIGYFECRPLVEDEAVLFVKWTLPVGGDYEENLAAFEELMAGLDLSEVQPD